METISTNSRSLKDEIIRILSISGGASIADLVASTGASTPTVTKYISKLENSGIIYNSGKAGAEHGRKPNVYKITQDYGYFVGIDPKRTSLMMAMINMEGETIDFSEIPMKIENTPETIENICLAYDQFVAGSGVAMEKIKAVTINLSGRVNAETGESFSFFNFENQDEPLAKILSRRLCNNVIIENDTRAMAYGELYGSVKGKYKDFLFINASWGIGMSIIIDGRIYYGKNGYSGEFGHTSTFDNEIMCHCGKKGCLETEASGKAVCSSIIEQIKNGGSSTLSALVKDGITEKDVIAAASNDDLMAIEAIETCGSKIGRQVANLINIFNPEAVIIGGTLAQAGDIFIQPIRLAARRYSLKLIIQDVDILPSCLGGKAGVTGACLRARDAFFKGL